MQSFVFNDIAAEPVPSLLRDFSAPVYLDFRLHAGTTHPLLAHEQATRSTPGSRTAPVQPTLILDAAAAIAAGQQPDLAGQLHQCRPIACKPRPGCRLRRRSPDPCLARARWPNKWTWSIPTPARRPQRPARHLAEELEGELATCMPRWPSMSPTRRAASRPAAARPAQRLPRLPARTRYRCGRQAGLRQFRPPTTLTDQFAALAALANVKCCRCPQRERALAEDSTPRGRTKRWSSTNGWPCSPAAAGRTPWPKVKALTHPAFDIANPEQGLCPAAQFRCQPGPASIPPRLMPSSPTASSTCTTATRRSPRAWRAASDRWKGSSDRKASATPPPRGAFATTRACRATCWKWSPGPGRLR